MATWGKRCFSRPRRDVGPEGIGLVLRFRRSNYSAKARASPGSAGVGVSSGMVDCNDAGTTAVRRSAGHQYPQRRESALARLAFGNEPMPRASDIVLRIPPDHSPQDADLVCAQRRPAAVRLRRIVDRWRGVRGPKSAPVEGEHELFGFLTTEANAIVAPIHPKAMPVILTTTEEFDLWLEGETVEALILQRPLPDGMLDIVARGAKEDPPVEAVAV
jgi:hypothetical protein